MKTPEARNEEGARYTIFSDSTAALTRAMSDQVGPGQAFARASIEVAERLVARGYSVTLLWVPAHKGVEGNEAVDDFAKAAGENLCGLVGRKLLR